MFLNFALFPHRSMNSHEAHNRTRLAHRELNLFTAVLTACIPELILHFCKASIHGQKWNFILKRSTVVGKGEKSVVARNSSTAQHDWLASHIKLIWGFRHKTLGFGEISYGGETTVRGSKIDNLHAVVSSAIAIAV